jgi:branched-chain amino acid transport system ATP-binding protein
MLTLHRVVAGYHGVNVVRDVDLVVPAGSSVALLGANGAGKTTLLKTVAGVGPQLRAGSITLDGRRIDGTPPHVRARLGVCLVPEGRGIFRRLTVRENLELFVAGGGRRHGAEAARRTVPDAVDRLLDAFPMLASFLDHRAGALSGGQQQMLALGRALVTDAAVVLADELSVGLAPVVVDEIFGVIGRMQAQGRSLLIVEQYVDRVLDVVDYVYILHKGRVVFVGEPEQCRGSAVFDRYLGTHMNERISL